MAQGLGTFILALWLSALLVGCGGRAPSGQPAPTPEGVVVTVRVADAEEYRLRLTEPDDIGIAQQLLAGEAAPRIPNGRVVRGEPDVNVGYSWHIDPDMVRRTSFLCGLALLVLLLEGAAPANVQQRACFPQTGHCVGGRFAQYWQHNGGLPVFGYPLSDELTEQGRTVQYFERARFELHTENAAPYDVLLGRLGAEVRPAPAPTPSIPAYASQDSPTDVLASYYNAINRQEYRRAYGYWETPPSPYDQFVLGYTDTASVQLIVQLPAFIGVGAGNAYSNIATVLIATRHEGSQPTFVGCYTTHKVTIQPDVWHLARATITPAAAKVAIPSALTQACAT